MLRYLALLTFCSALFACGPQPIPDDPGTPGGLRYEPLGFPVTINSTNTQITGTLVYNGPQPRTVIVAFPGATYKAEVYYDFPGLSFTRAMVADGYAVAMLNPLNVGRSGMNLSGASVNLIAQADALTAAIGGLKARFSRVVVAGHSLGVMSAIKAQSGIVHADALINTGFLHTAKAGPEVVALFQALIAQGENINYLLPPGSPEFRAGLFYAGGSLNTIQADNAAAVTVPQGWLADGFRVSQGMQAMTGSASVSGPVLVICARADALYPCDLAPQEGQYWTRAALNVLAVDGGHAINLSGHGPESWKMISEWIARVLP